MRLAFLERHHRGSLRNNLAGVVFVLVSIFLSLATGHVLFSVSARDASRLRKDDRAHVANTLLDFCSWGERQRNICRERIRERKGGGEKYREDSLASHVFPIYLYM